MLCRAPPPNHARRSRAEDVTYSYPPNVFACLHPLHGPASDAFDAVVKAVILESSKFQHHRRFLHLEEHPARESSVFTEDEHEDGRAAAKAIDRSQKTGSFQLSLTILPHKPAEGWYLGTSRGRSSAEEVDLLLAPPTGRRTPQDVAGRHARLFLHPESCRVVIEARHTVTLTRSGATTLSQLKQQVIQHNELVKIGECLYTFEYTDFFSTPTFEEQLSA